VGIGDMNPSAKLSLYGDVLGANQTLALIRGYNQVVDPNANLLLIGREGSADSGWEQFVVKGSGNVGIGKTSPTEKLEVDGKIKADGILFLDGTEMTSAAGTGLWNSNGSDISYNTGNVGIGTTTPAYKLAVKGSIGCSEVQVLDVTGWSDFVLAPDYTLRTLTEVEAFINQNQHLPDVPSEKEVKANGYDVSEMNAILLQKIEELTLYMIEQEKKIEAQDTKIEKVETENAELRAMKSEFENIKEMINQMNN
jgi:hypothetical protein